MNALVTTKVHGTTDTVCVCNASEKFQKVSECYT